MDKTIVRLNIEHLRKRLDESTDGAEKEKLRRMLADEEAKLQVILAREAKDRDRG